jgi:magnesium transporter
MNEIVNCATYAEGKRIADIQLHEVHTFLQEKNQFVWLGLHEPSEELLSTVKREFNLHELAIEDAHKAHQRPKVELYDNSVFIVLRTVQMNKAHHIEFGETHFFVGANFIVVVRHGSTVSYTDVRARCETTPELMKNGQGFVFYAIMDFIVDRYFPVVRELEDELELIEAKIFKEKPSRETTQKIYELKREYMEVKRAISPLAEICNRLTRSDISGISEATRPYMNDVYDHVLRINEMIDDTHELLNSAMEANFQLISIAQSDISKKFAAWAAIISIPTMVAGLYGMNFKFIPELDWHYGYYAVVVVTLSISLALYYFLKRSGWL